MNAVVRSSMTLRARECRIQFPRRPLVMGILNINDDSFSGDGSLDRDVLLRRAAEMAAAGADILDVGGESARTNRSAIPVAEEIARVVPLLRELPAVLRDAAPRDPVQVWPPLLSINTWRAPVAEAALAAGADILNDIGALPDDTLARLAARHGAALVIMHSIGLPKQPHTHVAYGDVCEALEGFFAKKLALAEAAGLPPECAVLDPGIDFAKQRDDNLRIYRDLERFARFGRPLLLPVSRKTVIGDVLGLPDPRDRDAGTAACIVRGCLAGAAIFRVHHVELAFQSIGIVHAVETVDSLCV